MADKGQRIGYVRVSTLDQNVERELDGIELDQTFTDKASGKDTKRPQLQAALKYLRKGDTFFIHSMDRLARNTEDLLRTVRELNERGVTVSFVYTNSTEQRALDELERLGAQIRVSYDERRTRLHAKAWLFHRDSGFGTAIIGSSNLSHSA